MSRQISRLNQNRKFGQMTDKVKLKILNTMNCQELLKLRSNPEFSHLINQEMISNVKLRGFPRSNLQAKFFEVNGNSYHWESDLIELNDLVKGDIAIVNFIKDDLFIYNGCRFESLVDGISPIRLFEKGLTPSYWYDDQFNIYGEDLIAVINLNQFRQELYDHVVVSDDEISSSFMYQDQEYR